MAMMAKIDNLALQYICDRTQLTAKNCEAIAVVRPARLKKCRRQRGKGQGDEDKGRLEGNAVIVQRLHSRVQEVGIGMCWRRRRNAVNVEAKKRMFAPSMKRYRESGW